MKLKDVLSEIKGVPQQPRSGVDIDSFLKDIPASKTTEVDGHKIEEYQTDRNLFVFTIEDNNQLVSWLFCGLYQGRLEVIRSWCEPAYRNKGFVTSLYKAVFSNFGYTLSSDDKLSPESISIWKKLAKIFPSEIRILNTENGITYPFTFDDASLFYHDEKFRFILSKQRLDKTVNEKFEIDVPEYIMFTGKLAEKFWKERKIDLL